MERSLVQEVKLEDIIVGDINVRKHGADKQVDELAASIKRHGLLQPILLLGTFGRPKYKIIVGQRRYLAHKRLNRTTIEAIFANVGDREAAILSLAENMQRVELNHADAAAAVTSLYLHYDSDDRRVAKETGMSLRRVRDYIAVDARATPRMKRLLRDRRVSVQDVKRALRAAQDNLAKAERILEFIAKEDLTGHQKRRVAEYGEENPSASVKDILEEAKKPRIEERLMVTLSDDLRTALGDAVKELAMEPEEVATKALAEWLEGQGFIE